MYHVLFVIPERISFAFITSFHELFNKKKNINAQCILWVKNKKLSLILRVVNNGMISIVKILNFERRCSLALHRFNGGS